MRAGSYKIDSPKANTETELLTMLEMAKPPKRNRKLKLFTCYYRFTSQIGSRPPVVTTSHVKDEMISTNFF